MVLKSSIVEFRIIRLTAVIVLLTTIVLGRTIGDWQSDVESEAQLRSASAAVAQNRGHAYLQLMESSVVALAARVSEVYPSSCDDWQECDVCTQDECRPLTGKLTCANISHNIRCNAHFQGCRSSIAITTERSAVAFPRVLQSIDSMPDYPQMRTICGTTKLDSTFKKLFRENPYHAEYYAGFPDGSRRSFPGREEADPDTSSCAAYDCRRRPWYNAAITYKNHLVILLDTKQEPLDASYFQESDTFSFAKEYAKKLLGTVYHQDLVNVVPFSSSPQAQALEKESVKLNFNQSNPQNYLELQPLLENLGNVRPAQDNAQMSSSNLTAGLQEALRLFNATTAMAMRNIVLFTTGDISYDDVGLNLTLGQLADNLVRLFIYSINMNGKLGELDAVAETVAGAHIRLTTLNNPLYRMRVYFNYLATMGALSRKTTTMPFWTPSYRDYYDLAELITVVFPAFSLSEPKKLVGVAAIDVLYQEIGDILEEFQKALFDRPQIQHVLIDAEMFRSVRVYDDTSTDLDSCYSKSAADRIFCTPNVKNTQQNVLDRMCCKKCSTDSGSGKRLQTIAIALGATFGGLAAVGGIVLVVLKCWFGRTAVEPRGAAGESDSSVQGKPGSLRKSNRPPVTSPRTKETAPSTPVPRQLESTPRKIHQSSLRLCVDDVTSPRNRAGSVRFPEK